MIMIVKGLCQGVDIAVKGGFLVVEGIAIIQMSFIMMERK